MFERLPHVIQYHIHEKLTCSGCTEEKENNRDRESKKEKERKRSNEHLIEWADRTAILVPLSTADITTHSISLLYPSPSISWSSISLSLVLFWLHLKFENFNLIKLKKNQNKNKRMREMNRYTITTTTTHSAITTCGLLDGQQVILVDFLDSLITVLLAERIIKFFFFGNVISLSMAICNVFRCPHAYSRGEIMNFIRTDEVIRCATVNLVSLTSVWNRQLIKKTRTYRIGKKPFGVVASSIWLYFFNQRIQMIAIILIGRSMTKCVIHYDKTIKYTIATVSGKVRAVRVFLKIMKLMKLLLLLPSLLLLLLLLLWQMFVTHNSLQSMAPRKKKTWGAKDKVHRQAMA